MHVCFVTTSFVRGPRDYYSRFVFEQARSLLAVDDAARVTVVAPHTSGAAVRETIAGVDVRRFRYAWPDSLQRLAYRNEGLFSTLRSSFVAKLNLPPFLASMFWSLYRASHGADVIHAQWLPTAFVARAVGRLRRLPVVVSLRGADVNALRGSRFGRRLAVAALCRVDHAVTVSDEFQRELSELGVDTPIETVPNGVDLEQFQPGSREDARRVLDLPADVPLLLYIGGLIARKRIDTLIEAFARVRTTHPNVRLLLVGEGPSEAELRSAARTRRCAEAVTFVGPVPRDRTHLWMNAADLFVLPSESEGRPNVVLEAFACRRPVIATRVNGTVELLDHETHGLLFDPDDVSTLASSIRRLLDDPNLAARLAANAHRSLAERDLTWRAHGERLLRIYERVSGV